MKKNIFVLLFAVVIGFISMFLSTLFTATSSKLFNESDKSQEIEKSRDDIYKTYYIGPQIANSSSTNLYDDAIYGTDYNEIKSLAIVNNGGDVYIPNTTKNKKKDFSNLIRKNTDLKYFTNVNSKG